MATNLGRRRLALIAPTAILAAGLAGAGAYVVLSRDGNGPVPIGGPFRLQAGDGRTVTEADFRGKVMLVYFGYTHCPDACPTALQDMANALDILGPEAKRKVAVVFISVDPERDTPKVVQDYVGAFDAPITALSGTPEQVAAAAKAYRVYYAKRPRPNRPVGDYDMDHSSIIYVMDRSGRFVANFTHESAPEAIAAKLRPMLG